MFKLTWKNLLAHKRRLELDVHRRRARRGVPLRHPRADRHDHEDVQRPVRRREPRHRRGRSQLDEDRRRLRQRHPRPHPRRRCSRRCKASTASRRRSRRSSATARSSARTARPSATPAMGAPTFAGNWNDGAGAEPVPAIVDGRPPNQTNEIVIDKQSASDGHLNVGDRTHGDHAAGPEHVHHRRHRQVRHRGQPRRRFVRLDDAAGRAAVRVQARRGRLDLRRRRTRRVADRARRAHPAASLPTRTPRRSPARRSRRRTRTASSRASRCSSTS